MAEQSNFAATMAAMNNPVETQASETTVNATGDLATTAAEATTPHVDNNTDVAIPTEETSVEATETVIDDSVVDFNIGGENAVATTEVNTTTNPPPTTAFNWKDEIKKIPKTELLKEAGLTDFAIEMDDYLAKGGKAADYLAAKAIDYNEVNDERIIKEDLKKQYPTFTPQQIDLMFNRKYTVPEDAEDEEKEFAQLQLKADAHNSRQSKILEQSKFKVPDTPILPKNEALEQWEAQKAEHTALIQQVQEFYNGHEATKALSESKRVTIEFGEGIKPLNIKIDKPELITTAMMDGGQSFLKRSLNDKGEPDVARQQLGTLLALNPYEAIKVIFNYGKSIGIQSKVAEGQNAHRPGTTAGGDLTQTGFSVSQGKFGDANRTK
jgi:hypothetical protein